MRFLALIIAFGCLIAPTMGFSYSKKNAYKHIEMVVFDLGGVVIKVNKQKVFSYLIKTLNISQEQAQKAVFELQQARAKGIPEETFWTTWAKNNSISLPDDWFQNLEETKMSCIQPDPDVLDIVDELKDKGYRVALFSNIQPHEAHIIQKLGIFANFDPVVLSYEIGAEKPDTKAFSLFESKALVPPDDCLFIDDTQKNVTAAEDYGMDTILYVSSEQLRNELIERRMLKK